MVPKVFLYGFEGVLCSCLENVAKLYVLPSSFLGCYRLYDLNCVF